MLGDLGRSRGTTGVWVGTGGEKSSGRTRVTGEIRISQCTHPRYSIVHTEGKGLA